MPLLGIAGSAVERRRRAKTALLRPVIRLWRKPGSVGEEKHHTAASPASKSQQTLLTLSSGPSDYSMAVHDVICSHTADSTLSADDDSCHPPPLTEVEIRVEASNVICDDDEEAHGIELWCTGEARIATGSATVAEPVVGRSGSLDARAFRLAVALTEQGDYEDALALVEDQLATSNGSQVGAMGIAPMWMLKANVLGLMGRYCESLECYQALVAAPDKTASSQSEDVTLSRADRANVLYACGRLCLALKDFGMAIEYYTQELEATVDLVGSHCYPSVSRIHHQIAHVYKECLGELALSVKHLSRALQAELAYLEQVQGSCRSCANFLGWNAVRDANSNTACCPTHTEALQGALKQVRHTKLQIGRTHFELGDLNQAIRLTLH